MMKRFASMALAATAAAEPVPQVVIDTSVTSGHVHNSTADEQILFSTVVREPGAPWMRLRFEDVTLEGDAHLRLTSVEDEAVQFLFREHIREWRSASAYFNGDAVRVELVAGPGEGGHLVVDEVIAGIRGGTRSQCGPTDDRLPSDDARVGRIMPVTCTAWLIDDCNNCLLTAGHCSSAVEIMQFNVPLSDPDGSINHPPPEDQYPVDPTSHQTNLGQGVGDDWAYFGCFDNPNTGLSAAEAQGDFFVLTEPVNEPGRTIRITGHGSVPSSVPAEWNFAQKTHIGPLVEVSGTHVEYQTDTTGGNSGSPIIDEATNTAIGIHTHGGCSTSAGNNGTSSIHPGLQDALANPLGICSAPTPDFVFPNGRPSSFLPDGTDTFVLEVVATDAIPVPGTAMLHYDDGSGLVSVALTQTSDNVYDVQFPATTCLTSIEYHFTVDTTDHEDMRWPRAPLNLTIVAATSHTLHASLDFETDPGWTVTNEALTSGAWERGVPVANLRGDPNADFDGSGVCYVTDNGSGNFDLDGGPTILTTGAFDLSGASNPMLSYAWWFTNDDGDDQMTVEISIDDGGSWSVLKTYTDSVGWQLASIPLGSLTLSDAVRFRFVAADQPNNSLTEAALDAFRLEDFGCGCEADWNGDTTLDVFDVLAFLGAFEAGESSADWNGDTVLDIFDVTAFLGDFDGC